MRKDKPYDKSVYRSLALILQFGINMLVPIGMMTALGIYLDGRFDTSFWTILLFFVGAVAGAQNIYKMAKRIFDTPADDFNKKERSGADENGGSIEKEKQDAS